MRVLLLTDDKYLYRKIELELFGIAEVSDDEASGYDRAIVDLMSFSGALPTDAIVISEPEGDGELLLPLRRGAVKKALLNGGGTPRLRILDDGRTAVLDGKRIRLTTHEYSLLALLIEGGGEFVARSTIAERVWENAGDGLINIYIHYLREKLELDGERIILSSRKLGYRINGSYLEVKKC